MRAATRMSRDLREKKKEKKKKKSVLFSPFLSLSPYLSIYLSIYWLSEPNAAAGYAQVRFDRYAPA